MIRRLVDAAIAPPLVAAEPPAVRLKFTTSIAGEHWSYAKDQIADVPAGRAHDMLRSGAAVPAPGEALGFAEAAACPNCGHKVELRLRRR